MANRKKNTPRVAPKLARLSNKGKTYRRRSRGGAVASEAMKRPRQCNPKQHEAAATLIGTGGLSIDEAASW
jgi:hypothetical protein